MSGVKWQMIVKDDRWWPPIISSNLIIIQGLLIIFVGLQQELLVLHNPKMTSKLILGIVKNVWWCSERTFISQGDGTVRKGRGKGISENDNWFSLDADPGFWWWPSRKCKTYGETNIFQKYKAFYFLVLSNQTNSHFSWMVHTKNEELNDRGDGLVKRINASEFGSRICDTFHPKVPLEEGYHCIRGDFLHPHTCTVWQVSQNLELSFYNSMWGHFSQKGTFSYP